jgi:hypothetical protein
MLAKRKPLKMPNSVAEEKHRQWKSNEIFEV